MPLHVSSTMYSSSGGHNLYYTASGIITLCRWASDVQVERGLESSLILCTGRCDDTRCCI